MNKRADVNRRSNGKGRSRGQSVDKGSRDTELTGRQSWRMDRRA